MSRLAYICILFLIALTSAVEVTQEEGVYVLTEASFDEFLAQHPFALVEFYAPWCGHCKKLAPEYAKAAQRLQSEGSSVVLGKVDSTVEKSLAEKFQIKGYPTLKFFNNRTPMDYNGGRTENEIVSWLLKKTGDVMRELTDSSALEKFISDNELAVVFFGSKDSEEFKTFEQMARFSEELSFGFTSVEELKEAKNAKANSVVLFKAFDERRNDFEGGNLEALKEFLSSNSVPTVIKFDQKAAQKIFGENKPTLFLFHDAKEESVKLLQVLNEVAPKFKGKIYVSTSPINDGLGKRLGDYVGVSENELPLVKIVAPNGGETKKFNYEGEVTAEGLLKFYDDWVSNRLKPVFKSAPVPEKNDEPVKVIVGKNWADIVLDSSKDVLVEFYAPWCGHCKNLAPIYDEVAKKLLVNPNIVLAKCDATANEIEGIPIQGFPTLKFFPANNKIPQDFSGERTEAGIINYLKSKTTVAWVELDEKKPEEIKEKNPEEKKEDL